MSTGSGLPIDDLAARSLRPEPVQVRVRPGRDETAAPAGAARPRRGSSAVHRQPGREVERQGRLADPGRTAEQDRVRRPDHGSSRRSPRAPTRDPGSGRRPRRRSVRRGRRLAGRPSLGGGLLGRRRCAGVGRRGRRRGLAGRPALRRGAPRPSRRSAVAGGRLPSRGRRGLAGRPALRRAAGASASVGRRPPRSPRRRSARPCGSSDASARGPRPRARPIGRPSRAAGAVGPASGRSGPGAAPRARAGPRSTPRRPRAVAPAGARAIGHRDRRSDPRAAPPSGRSRPDSD